MATVKSIVTQNEQLKYDNLRLLRALKVSLVMLQGDFHLHDEGISAQELINLLEKEYVKSSH